ncbi:predicted protein [Sclerotinia sclerotiorum 1980 UF-70]|uniref:Uncharacterized protein n=1 Tax=Sclerotinia sclerotiorum (strain ATCC 18683 / 1980 / Ss-1) TaxID=665079 RepID=A7EUJ2_SCLS1|nr:predicted protein [Sclerotinia sclerotiorum 1980 UF-70]EDN93134.1 predicted protein [Sclerotinia sclerotiorum 1980 UF-70]
MTDLEASSHELDFKTPNLSNGKSSSFQNHHIRNVPRGQKIGLTGLQDRVESPNLNGPQNPTEGDTLMARRPSFLNLLHRSRSIAKGPKYSQIRPSVSSGQTEHKSHACASAEGLSQGLTRLIGQATGRESNQAHWPVIEIQKLRRRQTQFHLS